MDNYNGALSPDENKPVKSFSKKTKRNMKALLCVVLGVAIAAGAIFLVKQIFGGARTPEAAAADYVRASMLYDAEGMAEYASPYAKVVLYGNRPTSDRLLIDYLEKAYADITPAFETQDLKFGLLSVTEYTEGDDTFDKIMKKYSEKADSGEVSSAAVVTMTVNNGKTERTHSYVVVKIGPTWYYAYTDK